MRMLISVLAMLLAMVSWASAGCWSDMLDTHLTAYWNNRWGEMATDCDEELMEEWLGVMCGMWDISHDITYVDCHTDWPLKTTNDWYDDYPRSRLFWVWADGWGSEFGQCGVVTEYYQTRAVRDSVYSQRVEEENWRDGVDIMKQFFPPYYCIALLNQGIYDHFGNRHKTDVLVWMTHGGSFFLKEEWCRGPTYDDYGWSFLGYNHYAEKTTECYNLWRIMGCLNCMEFPGTGGDLDDAYFWSNYIQMAGNPKNRMSCKKTCWNVAAHYTDVEGCNSTIYFEVTGEDVGTVYEVYGYRSFGQLDEPVFLGLVPGKGSDGYGRIRTYSFSRPGLDSYVAFRIGERGNDEGRVAYSRLFDWSGDTGHQWEERLITQRDVDRVTIPEPGGPDEFIYEVVMRDGEIDLVPVSTEEIAGRAVNFPENPDSASVGDVVVYGTDGWSVWCAMEQAELGNAWTSDQTIKARGYMGVSNLNATYAWLDTWSNNASWNQQYDRQFPYYPGPTLILVGDTEIIPPLTYDDNETEECQMPDCVTDMAFTDYWHTGPWALVQRIPSETNPELWTACENANTWNQGIHDAGVIERKATFFCGNTMWGVEQEGFETDVRLLEEQFIANGYATDFLAHSDYTWDERDDAAEHAFRDGFSNLIVQALETCPHFLSDFLSTENALSQLPPVSFFLHSFDCQTCGVWEPEGYYRTITEYMMFNNNMAGAIGMYNGGWEHQHERAQRIWTPIYLSAQPGEALDPYFFEFFLQMMERSPHYAMGISVLGAHHQVPPVNPASVEESELKHFIMTKRTMFDGTEIGLTLPEEAELSFSIYDIQGRRIACADLDMPSGRQTLTWDWKDANGHDAPCGVYFARIIANGTSLHERSLKVQVLR